MITELEGNTATGKSTFMYTGVTPEVVFAFDSGAVRALYGSRSEWFADRDIEIVQYPVPVGDLAGLKTKWKRSKNAITVHLLPQPLQTGVALQGMQKMWDQFTTMSYMAIEDQEIPTVGVDTMTIARRVAADCHLEYMQTHKGANEPMRQQLIQVEWGKPGDMVRTWYTQAQNQSEALAAVGVQKHFIVTHHLTERRDKEGKVIQLANGQPVMDMEGLHNTYRFVDVALRLEQTEVPNPLDARAPKIVVVQGTFMKCGYDLSKTNTKIIMGKWDDLAELLNKGLHPKAQIQKRD